MTPGIKHRDETISDSDGCNKVVQKASQAL